MTIYPHIENRCAIPADKTDWLEAYLTNRCNASCEWCFDKDAYHPLDKSNYKQFAEKILSFNQPNIILTGGEPTLYKDLKKLITLLNDGNKNVYITTNGSKLDLDFIQNLVDIKGITISIHHFDLNKNYEITKIKLDEKVLIDCIKKLHELNKEVRINCTATLGYLDTLQDIYDFIEFGKKLGVDAIRFAEVSYYDEAFVNLSKILNNQYDLSDEPFVNGCYKSTIINDMSVDFKLSCGALTAHRELPEGATSVSYKNVVYYDAESYKGWQSSYQWYDDKTIDNILDDFVGSKISKKKAIKYLSV